MKSVSVTYSDEPRQLQDISCFSSFFFLRADIIERMRVDNLKMKLYQPTKKKTLFFKNDQNCLHITGGNVS